MKKRFKKAMAMLLTLLVATTFSAFPFTVSAAEATEDSVGATSGTTGDCTWTLEDGVLTISGNGEMGDYNSNVYSTPDAPWKKYIFSKVVILYGVTNIGASAFSGCNNLTSVTIPNSVTSIGSEAFEDCVNLIFVSIPNSIKSIRAGAFARCRNLSSVRIPNSVTNIDASTFEGCSSLTSVIIPYSVRSISAWAFYDCNDLMSVTIPNSVISIGENAFGHYYDNDDKKVDGFSITGYESSSAETYANDNGFTFISVIDSSDFIYQILEDGTAEITGYNGNGGEVAVPSVIKGHIVISISEKAFKDCKSLIAVSLPNTVTRIANGLFYRCTGLTSIIIPNSVTRIDRSAFFYCSNLREISIPASVTHIENAAFTYCTKLTHIDVDSNNKVYCSIDGNLYNKDKTALIHYAIGKPTTSFSIPNSVTLISDSAFYACENLTTVFIPVSVRSIDRFSFYHCSKLSSVTIPESVADIGYQAFYECSNLTSMTIPKSVTNIGERALGYEYDKGYQKVDGFTISGYAGSIANNYANENGFLFIETIDSGTTGCCTWILNENGVLTISGNGAMENYNSHAATIPSAPWMKYVITKVIIENGVTSIGTCAFSGCYGITSVSIPNSVKTICGEAFENCSSLTSVSIPNSVTSIGMGAFLRCRNLTSISIPKTVTSIGGSAFEDCSSLTSVTISDSVTRIDSYAFYGCTSLTSITIPDSVKSIGDYAFYGCTNLAYIMIPNSLTDIGYKAFEETKWFDNQSKGVVYAGSVACDYKGTMSEQTSSITLRNGTVGIATGAFEKADNLQNIEIPVSLKTISQGAFFGCEQLNSISIPGSVTKIGNYAFVNCTSLTSIAIPPSVKSIGNKAFGYSIAATINELPYFGTPDYADKFVKKDNFEIKGKRNSVADLYATAENSFNFLPSFIYDFQWGTDNWSSSNIDSSFKGITLDENTINAISDELAQVFHINSTDLIELKVNIQYVSKQNWTSWPGSCFGMTVAEMLVKQGFLDLKKYDERNPLNSIEKSKEILTVISFLQELQDCGDYLQAKRSTAFTSGNSSHDEGDKIPNNNDAPSQKEFIEKIQKELENNDSLILIGYTYKEIENNNPIFHAVLGYGIQDGEQYAEKEVNEQSSKIFDLNKKKWKFTINGGTQYYDKRILIADPQHLSENKINDDACIYYNSENGYWICPYWNNGTDQCYYNVSTSDPGQIKLLIKYHSLTDPEFFPELPEDFIAGLTIISENGKPTGKGITEYKITNQVTDRYFYALENSKECTFEYNNAADYHMIMDYEHVTYYADVKNGKSMSMTPNGSITLEGENADYSLTIMPDKSVCGWNSLTVSGENANQVTLTKQDNGYLLETDEPGNVTITAKSDSGTITQEFSNLTGSLLICKQGDSIIVKLVGDVNCDGYVNVDDVTTIQRYLAEFDVKIDSFLADTNGDDYVNIRDVTQLQRYLAELIHKLG